MANPLEIVIYLVLIFTSIWLEKDLAVNQLLETSITYPLKIP